MDVMLLGCVTYQVFASYWPSASVEEEPLADTMTASPSSSSPCCKTTSSMSSS